MMVYVGENNKRLGLYKYQRYPSDYPAHIAEALAKNPNLKIYFIPWEQFRRGPVPGSVPKGKPQPPVRKLPPISRLHQQLASVRLTTRKVG